MNWSDVPQMSAPPPFTLKVPLLLRNVGGLLPTPPLWLRGGLCLPVELQATYDRTCVEQRVPTAA